MSERKNKSVVVRRKDPVSLDMPKKTWIKQSNLVTNMMAEYNLLQMKVLVVLVEAMQEAVEDIINNRDGGQLRLFQAEFDRFGKISIIIPLTAFGVNSANYKPLKSALKMFSNIPVEFRVKDPILGSAIKYTHLMDVILPEKYERRVRFEVQQDTAEKFLNMSGGFTKFIKEVVFKLNSPYAIKLYYQCCSWLAKGGWSMTVENLRQLLCVGDKYKDFKDFEKRVLKAAKQELENNANCWFEYRTVAREGEKRPYMVNFKIFRNAYTIEEEKYLEAKKENLKSLLFRHFAADRTDFEKIEKLLTYYNVDGALNKLIELYQYIEKHTNKIENAKEYCVQAMVRYLTPNAGF